MNLKENYQRLFGKDSYIEYLSDYNVLTETLISHETMISIVPKELWVILIIFFLINNDF